LRLDFFLTASRLVKRRSTAKALIEGGGVRLGGEPAKAGRQMRVGDEMELSAGRRQLRVRVLGISERRVSKEAARKLYEVLEEKILEEEMEIEDQGEPIDFLDGR
jgi:ribosomal 50S subunit-recycling heat shock protein